MKKKTVIISAGPIPGRLDSVKFITNRFKGGLSFKIAKKLFLSDFDVTIIKWKFTTITPAPYGDINVVDIDDVYDYMEYMTTHQYDAYILAGAVANLIPVNPWDGKFPSHNYKVGEEFDIKFTIAPRIIDEIKKKYPRSTLIGYKLFDGSEEELINAGWETLINSKSNVVFCNTPKTAKSEKIMLLPDGSIHKMSFDEHIKKIKDIINLDWYSTSLFGAGVEILNYKSETDSLSRLLDKVKVSREPYEFGTVACKTIDGAIITTTRGKREDVFCKIYSVNHSKRKVYATSKATLNAPFLDLLFSKFSDKQIILHGHKQLENIETIPYIFDGTKQYFKVLDYITNNNLSEFNIENHGYYKLFSSFEDAEKWVKYDTDNN